jgi:hypothetical protein
MILYHASRGYGGKVEEVRAKRTQDGTVVFDTGGGLERRVPMLYKDEGYFRSEAEAVNWLIDQAERDVASAKVKLVDAEKNLLRLRRKFKREET